MAMPDFSMRELIEAGVHFGHKTKRWNPHMAPYIYGVRNNTHIIDLGQTVPMLHRALKALRDMAAKGGKILFVGTKRQASDIIAEAARDAGHFYINQRWLGGLLTNWNTIQASIKRLKDLETKLGEEDTGLTKKELLGLQRQREKLERSLGGIKDMGRRPDMIFIIDTVREDLAIKEAVKLNIPIVAIVDSNASVENIAFPIPGNDDATRAIRLYCELATKAICDGMEQRGINPKEEARKAAEAAAQKKKKVAVTESKPEEKATAAEKPKTETTTKKAAHVAIAKKAQEEAKEENPTAKEAKGDIKEAKQEAPSKPAAAKEKPAKKPAAKKKDAKDAGEEKAKPAKKAAAKKPAAKKKEASKDAEKKKTPAKPAKKAAAKKPATKTAAKKKDDATSKASATPEKKSVKKAS